MEDASRSASPEPLLLRPSTSRRSRFSVLLGRTPGLRDPQAMVRDTAARQLESRRADWAYSRPVVAVDISWNIAFTVVSVSVLAATSCERPEVPLRVWVGGYALQCVFHVALVWSEYSRRRVAVGREAGDEERGAGDSGEDSDDSRSGWRRQHASFAKRCESLNTMASFIWWIVGFYWIISGGDALVLNAPRLYWLVAVFLAFDICFAIFFVALAFVIGIGLCCCLPCIIAVLYAVAGQEGATDTDIGLLRRYRYSSPSNNGEDKAETGLMIPIMNNSGCFPEETAISCEYTIKQSPGQIFISQERYATDLLKKFSMENCNSCATPISPGTIFNQAKEEEDVEPEVYRSLVGSLLYLTHTRPDIEYAVGLVSRFVSNPKTSHMLGAKRILRYIQGTRSYGLTYEQDEKNKLRGFSDSDWGGSTDDRRSTGGYIFFTGNKPISWSSRKQNTVALSSTEAEYMALCAASCEAAWLRRMSKEIEGEKEESEATPIQCDNQSAISLGKNPVFHKRSKHIELKYHFVREMIEKKEIEVQFCPTNKQLADILTKPLGRIRFAELRTAMNVRDGSDHGGGIGN